MTGTPRTLLDGSTTDSWSEAYRHECEARFIRGLHRIEMAPYLTHVKAKRGEAEWNRLMHTMNQLRARKREQQQPSHNLF
jgi:hypothetical protein